MLNKTDLTLSKPTLWGEYDSHSSVCQDGLEGKMVKKVVCQSIDGEIKHSTT